MAKKKKSKKVVYLHGYSKEEQDRLYYQARLLEADVFEGVDFSQCKKIIEVGCGVGAQTQILLERFPHLEILGVDLSEAQINVAKIRLKKYVESGQVRLLCMNAEKIGQLKENFDGAFICWFLEHVPDPLKILKALNKILVPEAKIYCTEVQNASFFVNPYSPNILKYWFEFNDFQWEHGGNPFMGATLGNLLLKSKYKDIDVDFRGLTYDSRDKKARKEFVLYFEELMFSAAENLIKDKRMTTKSLKNVKAEVKKLIKNENAVIQLGYMRITAIK
ncbi:MAG: class I SAM-dependent methyltransferase [Bdellovibrionota bacterium]